MVATTVFQEPTIREKNIPEELVHEEINGQKLYRRGYKDVLNQSKTIEEIMGCSSLQGLVISVLLKYLYRNLDEEEYTIFTNEIGLHISLGNNLSSDIIIYDSEKALDYQFDLHYFNVAPKIVIEVDVDIDTDKVNVLDYLSDKNKLLFGFGVERIIWVFTKSKQILIGEPNADWVMRDWEKDFEIIEGHSVNLYKLLARKGYQI